MRLTPNQQVENDEQRSKSRQTFRAVFEGMEKHLYVAREVLYNGFVRVVDYMGDHEVICQAARVSYSRDTKSFQNDEGHGDTLTGDQAEQVLRYLKDASNCAYDHYEEMISETDADGKAKQGLACMNQPANIYTREDWKVLSVLSNSLFGVWSCFLTVVFKTETFNTTFDDFSANVEGRNTAASYAQFS
ncbi:MAG: hypothetical protein ACI901_000560 [Octadecabacter sp.]|jgi:hypothetical protein